MLAVTKHQCQFSLNKIEIDELKITFTMILTLVSIIKKKNSHQNINLQINFSAHLWSAFLSINVCGVRLRKVNICLLNMTALWIRYFSFHHCQESYTSFLGTIFVIHFHKLFVFQISFNLGEKELWRKSHSICKYATVLSQKSVNKFRICQWNLITWPELSDSLLLLEKPVFNL